MSVPLRIEQSVHEGMNESFESSRPLRRRRPSRRTRQLAGIGVIAGLLSVLGLAGVGALTLLNGLTSASSLPLVGGESNGALLAISGAAHRAYGYVTVTGSVANTGNRGASNVEAVVELLDSQNRTVQLDKSMVAFASVPAGDSAPFRVLVQDDPSAVGYRLSFKHPDGRSIN